MADTADNAETLSLGAARAAARDESTLDLFHNDPAPTPAQAPEVAKVEAEPAAGQGGKVEATAVQAAPAAAVAPRRAARAKRVAATPSRPDGEAESDAKVGEPVLAPVAASEPPGDSPAPIRPEPDNARVAVLADTVAALHGVIADQRRATTDLSRRMKWMLAGVTGALLVTVAAGVIQTVVLARLASDASAQQQRLAQMMQDQQTALESALARLAAPPAAPASAPVAASSVTRQASPRHAQHAATHARRAHPASH
ncbi:hypothetical protein WJ542_22765 [Paraburkholderia sp. B3]|uniref:hypothetical protein n=1 Tax=Paraburkholderia sp. B3 TaxID=3134791 RepID=UPI00398223C9